MLLTFFVQCTYMRQRNIALPAGGRSGLGSGKTRCFTNFEAFQAFGKEQLEATTASASSMTKSLQAIAAEATDYSKKSIEQNTAFVEKLLRRSQGRGSGRAAAGYRQDGLRRLRRADDQDGRALHGLRQGSDEAGRERPWPRRSQPLPEAVSPSVRSQKARLAPGFFVARPACGASHASTFSSCLSAQFAANSVLLSAKCQRTLCSGAVRSSHLAATRERAYLRQEWSTERRRLRGRVSEKATAQVNPRPDKPTASNPAPPRW